MRLKYRPTVISCSRQKLLKPEYKVVSRDVWLIRSEHWGFDAAGNRLVCRLWLDNDTNELWWEEPGGPTHLVRLGAANPHLTAEPNQVLEEAERDLPRTLGALAARQGIDVLTSGG